MAAGAAARPVDDWVTVQPDDWVDVPRGTSTDGESGPGSRFAKALWEQINPLTIAEGLATAIGSPIETAKGILKENQRLADEARSAAGKGDYLTATRKGLAFLANGLPGFGSALDYASEQAGRGDVAGALGTTAGLGILTAGGPAAVRTVAKAPAAARTAARAVGEKAGAALRSPGVPEMVTGASQTLSGAGMVAGGHPIIGGALAARGVENIRKGIDIKLAKRSGAPPPTKPRPIVGSIVPEGLETSATPRQSGAVLPEPAAVPPPATPGAARRPPVVGSVVPEGLEVEPVRPALRGAVVPEPVPVIPLQGRSFGELVRGVPRPTKPPVSAPARLRAVVPRSPEPPPDLRGTILKSGEERPGARAVSRSPQAEGPAISPGEAPPAPFEGAYPVEGREPGRAAPREQYERAARTVKSRALARYLHSKGVTVEELEIMTPDHWKAAASETGVREPSAQSIRQVGIELRSLYDPKIPASDVWQQFKERSRMAPGATPAAAEPARVGRARGPETAQPAVTESLGAAPATGAQTRLLIPGSDRVYEAGYEVRELSDVQASHSGRTFAPNPKYGLKNERDYSNPVNRGKILNGSLESKFEPTFHITDNPDATNGPVLIDDAGNALGGNGRLMILERVYGQQGGAANRYRALLQQKAAQFGLDPEKIAGMKEPVLVRRVPDSAFTTPTAKADVVGELNVTGTAALTPAERIVADSRRVSLGTMDEIARHLEAGEGSLSDVLDSARGPEILEKLIDDGVIQQQDRAAYIERGSLTKPAKERISKLMVGRFFRDPAQLDVIDPGIKTKIERVSAPLASAEAVEGWTLVDRMQDALDLIEAARSYGRKDIDLFVKQSGLYAEQQYPAATVDLAKKLQKWTAGDLQQATRSYIEEAKYARKISTEGRQGLFGDLPEPMTPEAAYQEHIGSKPLALPKPPKKKPAALPLEE